MKKESYPYSLDEFLSHFRALDIIRDYEYVHLSYSEPVEPMNLGAERDPEGMMFRLMDYFAQNYGDRDERTYKMVRFHMAIGFTARHMRFFERNKLAFVDTEDSPAYVSPSILKAVHRTFAVPDAPREIDVDPAVIVALAKEFEKEDG